MKKIYMLLVVAFAFTSCNCQKQTVEGSASAKVDLPDKLPTLEYVAHTRGFRQKIVIENQTVTISSERLRVEKNETIKLSDADSKELTTALQKFKLNDLPTFKDPTQKRFYDGAAIASLKVTTADGKSYQTVDFDHEFPPAEIEKLVNKIVSFDKK